MRRWGPFLVYIVLAAGFVVTAENHLAALGCIIIGAVVGLATRPKK